MSASFTEENLAALEQAIATGAREVYYGDKRVAYRSLDEMLRVRDLMKETLGQKQANQSRIFTKFNRGFN